MSNRIPKNAASTETWWDGIRPALRALLILALVLGVLWVLAQALWLVSIKAVWSYVVDSIQEITGLNTFLAKAIATIGAVPLLLGVVGVLSFKTKRRNLSISVIAIYIVVFNISMYAATRNQNIRFADGEVMRYCAVTPKEVYCADKPGFDPTYGMKLEPMTPERILLVDAYKNRLASGTFQPVELTQDTQIFDPITGEAVVFYAMLANGQYRFFNGPGFDTSTGTQLQPVSQEIIADYWQGLEQNKEAEHRAIEAQKTQQLQAIEKQKRDEQLHAQKAELEARKLRLRGFFNETPASANQLDVAVSIRVPDQSDSQPMNTLIDALKSGFPGARFHNAVFRNAFLSSSPANDLYEGNFQVWQEAREFGMLSNLDRVLLGAAGASCAPGFQDTVRCDVTFEYRAFDADGNLLNDGVVRDVGAGFDRRSAAEAGFTRIADKLRATSRSIIGA